jgi:ABC-type methionine transport system permease subunit
MIAVIVVLIALVALIQAGGDRLARLVDHGDGRRLGILRVVN